MTDDCSSEQNQNGSPLLRLPAELRNKIYAYVSDHITFYYDQQDPYAFKTFKAKLKHDNYGLLLACQQLLYEAKPYINTHQYMTWRECFRDLSFSAWTHSIKMTQIKEIVLPASQEREHDHSLEYMGSVIAMWPSLRYIEIQRDFTRAGQEEALEFLRKDISWRQNILRLGLVKNLPTSYDRLASALYYPWQQKDFEVHIKCKEGKAVWTYSGKDDRLISSWEPSSTF